MSPWSSTNCLRFAYEVYTAVFLYHYVCTLCCFIIALYHGCFHVLNSCDTPIGGRNKCTVLQVVDGEKHPSGYILEGTTPVAQEQKEQEEADNKDENKAQVNGNLGSAGASTSKAGAIAVEGVEGEVIDLMDDDDDVLPSSSMVGEKRKLADGIEASTSKMQKTDEVIELD